MEKIKATAISVAAWTATPQATIFAVVSLMLYFVAGLICGFSETYNIVANTFMSAVSYLMLFLLQMAQVRGDRATHIKLDELIRAEKRADNRIIGIEELSDDEIMILSTRIREAQEEAETGKSD